MFEENETISNSTLPGVTADEFSIKEVNRQHYLVPKGAFVVDSEALKQQQQQDDSLGADYVILNNTVCDWDYFIPAGTPIPNTEEYQNIIQKNLKSSNGRRLPRESILRNVLMLFNKLDSLPENFIVPAGTFVPSIPSKDMKKNPAHEHQGCDCGSSNSNVYMDSPKYNEQKELQLNKSYSDNLKVTLFNPADQKQGKDNDLKTSLSPNFVKNTEESRAMSI